AQGAVLLGQPRNAGSTLRALLQAALQRPWQSYDHVSEASGSLVRNKPLVILGSKEYATEIMPALGKDNRPSIIYLSDDSLGAANVQHEARRLATPVFVAALKRSEGQTGLPDHTTDELERNAARIPGRPPGPYFLTSWFAIHFALKGLGQGTRTSAELLTSLQSQPWKTVYGPIRFDNFGRAEGFTWELRSMS
ncbi:hypothetical protein AL035_21950, partial [Salipiger aestuarii]|uniref:hypothetical protein n=1 Tax=Salipiger aestuarii TaxID=568098 RepID=UPI001981405B